MREYFVILHFKKVNDSENMLQIVQYQKNGKMVVEKLPAPTCLEGGILIQTAFSLISAGTEKTSVTNSQGSLLSRAKKQPDQVKLVIDTIKKQGLVSTFQRVKSKLDSFKSLGYSASGIVLESRCDEFKPGDRVAVAGAGYANHAEFITVPKNLAAKIPENVDFSAAAYTTVATIAMQGVRQADPRLGETVAVIGLGLIGLITVQILKAAGCKVIGMDINTDLFEMAEKSGCDMICPSSSSSISSILAFTNGIGCDSVILTASTSSSQPIQLAMEIARPKSNVVIVGALGLNLQRHPFYKKEINLKISSSYGPGRYDAFYEEYGHDYPVAYVRWTENRNMQSILTLMSQRKLDLALLTSHVFPIQNSTEAYTIITGEQKVKFMGILISYDLASKEINRTLRLKNTHPSTDKINLAFVGLGQFATNYLLPTIKSSGANLIAVANSTSVNSLTSAKQHGFALSSTEALEVIGNPDVNTVFVATRHDMHAAFVVASIAHGKAVFVEKPLCTTNEQLNQIKVMMQMRNGRVMVGFNRRFSKPFQKIQSVFAQRTEPMAISYRVNAGTIPKSHWVHSPENGGRIIGEACHFIDVMCYLTNSTPEKVYAECISANSQDLTNADSFVATIKFKDGSIGKLEYLANGDSSLPKEYCEVFCEKKTAIMHNFDKVDVFSSGSKNSFNFDGKKGIEEEVKQTLSAIKEAKAMPIPFDVIEAVTKTTFAINSSLTSGLPVFVDQI